MNADELAVSLARWACGQIRSRPEHTRTKANPADIVTDTDIRIEDHVRERIAAAFPGHGVIGEERPPTAGSPTWYLDPVDGTTNYASGIGWSSFSLALADDQGPVLGVVADPYRDEIFTARRGGGAFLNGRPVRCTAARSLAGTVVLTEWNGHVPWPGAYQMIDALSARHCTVRVMGSSALSLATMGAGRAAAVVFGTYHPVDTLAGLLIATEAGAVLDTSRPGPAGMIAAAPGLAGLIAEGWS
jgi:myo-inositol-1(or 4)-monophosphatase